ncbi:MAG: hypothetical protein K9M49_09125 [Candidatus Marinimicrobia bacterium]|nr:hypothetical protein [Candidatus Neomarinimicrobiota bacterium]MCF7851434.1 hypothetical protein [Candidatus Neomarinimicrobiota bacterium]MCF7905296.1 hypothetical protein [Candidatus Neomarinimicrobiota bacterium]
MAIAFKEAIEAEKKGLLIKNSIFLPFHMELLSIWAGKEMSLLSKPDIITDFSHEKGDVFLREGESYTNLIFTQHSELKKDYGHKKGHIILYGTEKGADIFDRDQRHYVKLWFHHDKDDIDLELIDDPFDL